ncbi:lipopolysaccharide kinase InaA family protein [Parabacteroides sp. GYB001]|uniref:lipopolysaccharide kinase InaA family protein n=1 Tax=Parabacteroides leei TaxID=2939491 RepID=UPI002016C81C|nr:lipopolysaccharide kinase InaA family protein [Parabacteroides leei]MCL3853350.1 lipopolysaccharide kinase InaA family protein [Parabacteroides leei]
MKIEINPKYNTLTSFIQTIPEQFDQSGSIVYEGRNVLRKYVVNNLQLVVKSFKPPHLINRFVYGNIRKSKAFRSFHYALLLRDQGINTPEPVAYIEQYNMGLVHSYYISLESPFTRNLREFWFVPEIGDRRLILKEFGLFTARMHELNVLHRDYSAGNVLFGLVDGKISFDLVDINRMSFNPVSEEAGYKNFAPLWLTDDAYMEIAKAYARGRGFDEIRAVKRVLFYKNLFMEKHK